MHVEAVLADLEARVLTQGALMAGDEAETVLNLFVEAMRPALRDAAMTLAEQAAEEVRSQLSTHTVDVTIVDGDPTLQVRESVGEERTTHEEFDARITLRLPPSLKDAIEGYAGDTGESVNSWVVNALQNRAQRRKASGRVTTSFDL